MDVSIHVVAPTEEKHNELVDYLTEQNVELVVEETSPLVTSLFYDQRRNAKLDNLGQLRHLFKMLHSVQAIAKSVNSVAMYSANMYEERVTQQWQRERFVRTRVEAGDTFSPPPWFKQSEVRFTPIETLESYFTRET